MSSYAGKGAFTVSIREILAAKRDKDNYEESRKQNADGS
jgi:hypothetical protein